MSGVKAIYLAISASAACLLAALPATAQDSVGGETSAAQCRGANGYAADFEGRRTFLWRPAWLEGIKAAAQADDAVMADIVRQAEAALKRGPYSVTDKPRDIPGAGPNDYASIGPYWWPDASKDDGLPYTRRDGEVNPERDGPEFDKDRLRNLGNDMHALALAHYVTSEDRFARHAALLVRTWFLDPATRMAPNFNFAQGIPGRVDGRGEGIIESSDLSTIVEAIGLIRPSGALSTEELEALRGWYRDFVVWMATSDNGESEMRKSNNHGVFYDFYLAHFALFAGAEGAAANVVEAFPEYRLAPQMDRQGRFIAELQRTRSWHYAHYVVNGAARLATIGECVDQDLWSQTLDDGRGLATANAFLGRYADAPATWPFPDRDLSSGRIDLMEATTNRLTVLFDGVDAAVTDVDDLP